MFNNKCVQLPDEFSYINYVGKCYIQVTEMVTLFSPVGDM